VDEVTGEPLYRDRVCGIDIGKAGLVATIRVPSGKDPARRAAAVGRLPAQQRRRLMSFPLVIRLMVAMTLMPDASYCEALRRLTGLLAAVVPAENLIRAGQAACSYSCRMPQKRSRRRTSRRASRPGSVIGSGSGWSGLALAMPWCGLCAL
jgi:hypothetical protein